MSQHDYVIANASGATVRADLNSLFQALLSQNSGTSAPTTTASGMLWLDTTGGAPYTLKIRDAGNNHWLSVASITDPGSDGNLSMAAIEGSAVLSTGESGTAKFLRVDGDVIYGDEAEGAAEGPLGFAPTRTGTSEQLVASDLFKGLELSNSLPITFVVPPVSEVYSPAGAFVEIYQGAAGQITFVGGLGVTLKSNSNRLSTGGENSVCVLRHVGNNVWRVAGDLA